MASSSRVDETLLAQWKVAVQEGHRSLKVAEKLLYRGCVAPCPLPVDTPEQVGEESEQFMDLLVVALHWAGPPDSAPTSALLAIPEAASHGVQGATAMHVECYFSDGQISDTAPIVVLMASAEYLAKILGEGTPASSDTVTFVPDVARAAPLGSAVFSSLTLPDGLQQGYWLHLDETAGVRYMTGGAVGDDVYVSAVEEDLPSSPSVLLTEVLPQQQPTRRGTTRPRRPSVLALGPASNAKALAAMLSAGAKAAGIAPSHQPKSKAVAKASERDLLAQLTSAVTS
eukprot:6063229-Amphidinium_carterae.2